MDLGSLGSQGTLLASLIWGGLGSGFFIYGKKQQSFLPMIGGAMLVAISYFISDALWMSVTAIAIIAGMWFLRDRFD